MSSKDINYALVEEKRPPIYTAMKYWGKKPHNIWRAYIKNYTPINGIFLDPFAGSAISAFEGVKAGRKSIAFDLNPLSTFLIEVLSSKFDRDSFSNELDTIISSVMKDEIYKNYLSTKCRLCGNRNATIQNHKWNNGTIYELGIICPKCHPNPYKADPIKKDFDISNSMNLIEIIDWYPSIPFHESPSFSAGFIKNIGVYIF